MSSNDSFQNILLEVAKKFKKIADMPQDGAYFLVYNTDTNTFNIYDKDQIIDYVNNGDKNKSPESFINFEDPTNEFKTKFINAIQDKIHDHSKTDGVNDIDLLESNIISHLLENKQDNLNYTPLEKYYELYPGGYIPLNKNGHIAPKLIPNGSIYATRFVSMQNNSELETNQTTGRIKQYDIVFIQSDANNGDRPTFLLCVQKEPEYKYIKLAISAVQKTYNYNQIKDAPPKDNIQDFMNMMHMHTNPNVPKDKNMEYPKIFDHLDITDPSNPTDTGLAGAHFKFKNKDLAFIPATMRKDVMQTMETIEMPAAGDEYDVLPVEDKNEISSETPNTYPYANPNSANSGMYQPVRYSLHGMDLLYNIDYVEAFRDPTKIVFHEMNVYRGEPIQVRNSDIIKITYLVNRKGKAYGDFYGIAYTNPEKGIEGWSEISPDGYIISGEHRPLLEEYSFFNGVRLEGYSNEFCKLRKAYVKVWYQPVGSNPYTPRLCIGLSNSPRYGGVLHPAFHNYNTGCDIDGLLYGMTHAALINDDKYVGTKLLGSKIHTNLPIVANTSYHQMIEMLKPYEDKHKIKRTHLINFYEYRYMALIAFMSIVGKMHKAGQVQSTDITTLDSLYYTGTKLNNEILVPWDGILTKVEGIKVENNRLMLLKPNSPGGKDYIDVCDVNALANKKTAITDIFYDPDRPEINALLLPTKGLDYCELGGAFNQNNRKLPNVLYFGYQDYIPSAPTYPLRPGDPEEPQPYFAGGLNKKTKCYGSPFSVITNLYNLANPNDSDLSELRFGTRVMCYPRAKNNIHSEE